MDLGTDMSEQFDVVILGGGLAGMTLALQLKQQSKEDISIGIVDRAERPLPEAACKVGESTVEVSSHYLADVLGLKDHIEAAQLPKLGLRCFFAGGESHELPDRLELGSNYFWPRATYQLDRGRFENFLFPECVSAGVEFFKEARVDDVNLSELGDLHAVHVRSDNNESVLKAKWVVDASGRAAILRKKLNLEEQCQHSINAVWFRIEDKVDLNQWYSEEWASGHGDDNSRWFSTNHLVGEGYWTWIIPLASGSTSIGIVADPRYHSLEQLNAFEKSVEWLKIHEPRLGKEIEIRSDKVQDFLALKKFSRRCSQVFSQHRWGITGDAGVFIDPFYSPGADFIAYSNTYLTDLIVRDLSGQRVTQLTRMYNDLFISFADHTFQIYQDQYGIFGNSRVLPIKIIWDFAIYWCFLAFLFCQDRFCELHLFAKYAEDLKLVSKLNGDMQNFLREWHQQDSEPPPKSQVDLRTVPVMLRLNEQLEGRLDDDDEFDTQLAENLQILFQIASEIAGVAVARCEGLEMPSFAREDHLTGEPLLKTVYDQMGFDIPKSFQAASKGSPASSNAAVN
jgi:flavin-dependent dehydrogenase